MLLKFRAWSVLFKKYLNTSNIYLANDCEVREEIEDYMGDSTNLIVIEHSTDKPDKHNKIIYEGDIVDNGNTKSVVIFKDGAFRFEYNEQPIYNRLSSELEIVGNVHDGEKNEV